VICADRSDRQASIFCKKSIIRQTFTPAAQWAASLCVSRSLNASITTAIEVHQANEAEGRGDLSGVVKFAGDCRKSMDKLLSNKNIEVQVLFLPRNKRMNRRSSGHRGSSRESADHPPTHVVCDNRRTRRFWAFCACCAFSPFISALKDLARKPASSCSQAGQEIRLEKVVVFAVWHSLFLFLVGIPPLSAAFSGTSFKICDNTTSEAMFLGPGLRN